VGAEPPVGLALVLVLVLVEGAGLPNGENATAGTAAANASTPAAKMNPAGTKPSSPSAGDHATTRPANDR
jgi:hypothetical protein